MPRNTNVEPLKKYWWQKGQSGNPAGKPKNLFTRKDVDVLMQRFASKTKDEIQEILNNPKSSMIELLVGSIIIKAIKSGDHSKAQFLLDQSVGKPKETLDINLAPSVTYKTTMTEDGRMLQEIVKDLKEIKASEKNEK